ncbi:MAG: methionine--tRNA ligase [Myxococcota bacterium]
MTKPFYITTPIYYPNAAPHIGSTYTTTYADTLARYHRALGEETFFLTGTDEHGEKIAEAAAHEGIDPASFVERISARFRATWAELGLTPDRFIRTTDADHRRGVQHFWQQLYDAGEIEFRDYTGRYCVGCESFLTERELVDGRCPQHLREPEERSEANYFFRMSRHLDWWVSELECRPDLVAPERYRKEVLSMVRGGGLEDLCISRPRERLAWGIPLPFDENYVLYVWTDALLNYLTGIGYPDGPDWKRLWGGVHHLIAKDILKPHAVFWPTMLHAAGLPLYRGLRVHGYWSMDRQKISKSLGNLVDPLIMKQKYGFDAFRYYLLREMSFGLDGEFSEEAVVQRINADLANDLGNLLQRSLSMVERYFEAVVPTPTGSSTLAPVAERVAREIDAQIKAFSTQRALAALWELVSSTNRYLDARAPWKLAKDPDARDELATVIYECLESLRVIATLLDPFLPETSERMTAQLGAQEIAGTLPERLRWRRLPPGTRTHRGEALFPRIETA